MSDNVATEIAGATVTAVNVQQAVAQQSNIFDKIMAGLEEFLTIAPTIAGAIDPAISTFSTGIANMLKGIVGAAQSFHETVTVPAANVKSE